MGGGLPAEDELAASRVLRCTVCGDVVSACSVCATGFLRDHVIFCRREDGHDHANCVTARRRRLLRPREDDEG